MRNEPLSEMQRVGRRPLAIERRAKGMVLSRLQCLREHVYLSVPHDELATVPPFHIAFSREKLDGKLLAVADEEGCLSFYTTRQEVPRSLEKRHHRYEHGRPIAKIAAHENAIFDMIWCNRDEYIATASGDQRIGLWDVQTGTQIYNMPGHSMSVKCIRQHPTQPNVFASGSRDGNIFLWDVRIPPIASTVPGQTPFPRALRPFSGCNRCHDYEVVVDKRKKRRVSLSNAQRSVTCIEFSGDGTQMISAGAADGQVKFWDIRNMLPPACKTPKLPQHLRSLPCFAPSGRRCGITSLSLDGTKTKLLVSTLSHEILLYDLLNTASEPIAKYFGHRSSSFYVKSAFSPDADYIVSGSVDQKVYIWDVNRPGLPQRVLHGHEGEVSSVAWCPSDFAQIASCSDDGTIRIWTVGDNKPSPIEGCTRGCSVGYSTPYSSPDDSSSRVEDDAMQDIAPPERAPVQVPTPPQPERPVRAVPRQPLTLHHFWQ